METSAMDTTAKTESIIDVIKRIEEKNTVLPEFQRDFVWEVGKTYDLFDSLVKNIFIGSIIYGVPSFEITTREIDIRPRAGKGSREKLKITSYKKAAIEEKTRTSGFRLLLDGQQRLTSIYRALKGADKIWFIAKSPNECCDNGDFHENTLEQILSKFSGQEDLDCLSVKLSDVFEIMQNYYREHEIQQKFFNVLSYQKQFAETEKSVIFGNYLAIVQKLQDLFKSEKLVSYYLLDTTLEKFALFFERSNSRGIQLNFIDILAAKLYDGFNLRDKIAEFKEKYQDYSLNEEIIVRTISFIVSNRKYIERSYILGNLTAENFTEHWDDICDYYRKTLNFLSENHMILAQSWMPYENMLIPLMIFLRELNGNFSQMTEKQNRFIRFWYWASIFAQRYTGSSNEIIIQDSLILFRIAQGEKITDRNYFFKLRILLSSPEELHSFMKKGSVVYKGILNLMNYKAGGLIDWTSISRLSFNDSRLEDHHIFPRKYLLTKYQNNEKILSYADSVVNKTLIPKLTNIKIGQSPPSKYLKELQNKNPRLDVSLEKHLIPIELLNGDYDEDYMSFLEKRATIIFEIIKDNITNIYKDIRSEFYLEPQITQDHEKIQVFSTYYNQRIEADYYPGEQQVLYKGKSYSPSGAAGLAKKDISGKDNSTNGWEFWKFIDEQGQEKCILELRKLS